VRISHDRLGAGIPIIGDRGASAAPIRNEVLRRSNSPARREIADRIRAVIMTGGQRNRCDHVGCQELSVASSRAMQAARAC